MTAPAAWIPLAGLPAPFLIAMLLPGPSITCGPSGTTVAVQAADKVPDPSEIEATWNGLRSGRPVAGRAVLTVPASCVEVTA